MAELEEDENLEKNEADVDIDDVLAQQVSPPKSSGIRTHATKMGTVVLLWTTRETVTSATGGKEMLWHTVQTRGYTNSKFGKGKI